MSPVAELQRKNILPHEFSCRLCRARFVTEVGFDHHLKMEMIIVPEDFSEKFRNENG